MPKPLQHSVQDLMMRDEKELASDSWMWRRNFTSSIGLFDTEKLEERASISGLPDHLLLTAFCIALDPLRHYVTSIMLLFMSRCYLQRKLGSEVLYVQGCGRQYDHEHAMTGPIVVTVNWLEQFTLARWETGFQC